MTTARRDRYAQCDSTCTVDCGACKGAGGPEMVSVPRELLRRIRCDLLLAWTGGSLKPELEQMLRSDREALLPYVPYRYTA